MATIPTYILAPNFTYTDKPNKSWLGRIIRNPLDPTSVIDNPTAIDPADIETTPESENTYKRLKGRSFDASLWATFFQIASAKVSGSISRETSVSYTMSGMETKYLDPPPTNKDIAKRVEANPDIKAEMDSGLFGHKPVYMISGLKIAKDLVLTVSKTSLKAGSVGGEAPITPGGEISAGGEVGGSRRIEITDSSKSLTDVIFAYQLHIVAESGWKKRLTTKVHQSEHGFLGSKEDAEEEFEAVVADKADLDAAEFQDGGDKFESMIVEGETSQDGNDQIEKCVCIVGEE